MAGFADKFEAEVDPAAEFLAREQDELAGLEDEVKPAATSNLNSDDPTNSASSFEMVEGIDHEGLGIKTKEDSTFLDTENDDFRGALVSVQIELTNPSIILASPSPPPSNRDREEPEKIKIWRQEQVKRLEVKDAEEEKKKLELRAIAKKELEDWYKNHEEAIAKTKAANRNAEKQFVAEDDEIEPGTEWERIAKLCDFNPKAKQGSKDVSRMRSIVLQMKQSPMPINNKA